MTEFEGWFTDMHAANAEIASLRAELEKKPVGCLFQPGACREQEVANLRANRAALELKLNEAWADRDKWCAEVDKRAAVARQDAELRAILKKTVYHLAKLVNGTDDEDPATWEAAKEQVLAVRAALACRPHKGEDHE